MDEGCQLCDLPLPAEPATAPDVDGTFCCPGCLEVARVVGEGSGPSSAAVRDRARRSATNSEPGAPEDGQAGPRDGAEGDTPNDTAAEPPDDVEEAFLTVEGMHCTTCEAFLALRGEDHAGVERVDASYATDTLRVRYDPGAVDADALPALFSGYGYDARALDATDPTGEGSGEVIDAVGSDGDPPEESVRDRGDGREDSWEGTRRGARDRDTVHRLVVGGALAMLVMPWYVFFLYPSYVGIETGILSADMTTPVGLYFPMAVVGVLSAVVVFYTGWPILRGAYVSLRTRRPNMDLLLSVAILSAFLASTVALASGSTHLYYDVAITIVLVVTAGTYYEGRLKRDATARLSALTAARVRTATRRAPDGTTETVPVDALASGDAVVVAPGERVPVDGTVREGTAAVDEAVLTGESVPRTVRPGDAVAGGSVVADSSLVVEVDDGAESTLDRLTSLVWAAQSEGHAVQRFADQLATAFVPLVLVVGVAVAAWHFAEGGGATAAVLAGLTVLVAACPCAMGLATPLAVAAGLRDALERGVVVTTGALFEATPDLETVVFDKTGTLTTGEMTVHEVAGDRDALPAAAALERRSAHPVATAVVEYVAEVDGDHESGNGGTDGGGDHDSGLASDGGTQQARTDGTTAADPVESFERHPGAGVSGTVDGDRVVVGTPDLVTRETGSLPASLVSAVDSAREAGNVPVVVGREGEAAAVLTVGDRPRDGWRDVLESVADRRVVLLTGDDASATAPFADHPAVDEVLAGVPPDGKVAAVERFAAEGTTAMIGDGTNDAPALARADVGVALAGTARAGDAADAVVVDGSLADVPAVFELARRTRRRIRENVGWALCYNGVAVPLAAAGVLNPLLAAVAMATSSLLVVTNSRRSLL